MPGYSTDLFADRAVRFIEQQKSGPFFLYAAFNAPHWPFQGPHRPTDIRTGPTWYDGTRQDYIAMVADSSKGLIAVPTRPKRLSSSPTTMAANASPTTGRPLIKR